ncbi:FRG domain-containing protein [Nitrosomonas supralitoralis]|nr:FRG domain-containing protein [Nitrosomonas supralitoralis]
MDYVFQDMLEYEKYIWRGQRRDDWRLVPSIDRLIQNGKISQEEHYKFQEQHLKSFKLAARGLRGANPSQINEENDWWALGQHHGLATPLLDWTKSPFIAAFFAFIEIGDPQTESRAIFALHQSVDSWSKDKCRKENMQHRKQREEYRKANKPIGLLNSISSDTDPELIFIKPFSDENQRLINQSGLFTRSMTKGSIESWVSKNHSSDDEGMTLIKFLIPDKEREKCLQTLNRMNINPLTLFPDLSGASIYCNLHSEIRNY